MAHIRLHLKQADGHLPMVCMRCGAPATVVRKKIMHCGNLGRGFGKETPLRAPFCGRHQYYWWRSYQVFGTVVVLEAAIAAGIAVFAPGSLAQFFFAVAFIVFLIGSLVLGIVVEKTGIRLHALTATHIVVAGVCEEFIEAVAEAEVEHRLRWLRLQDAALGDTDPAADSPPPSTSVIGDRRAVRPTPPSDAIEP